MISGAPGTPPADALIDYLNDRRARAVTAVFHPLQGVDGAGHLIRHWRQGQPAGDRRVPLPARPPLTYPLDLAVPPLPGRVDHWVAFNCLEYLRGAALRRLRRVRTVTYWVIDFVPDRFGTGTPATRAYDRLDRAACRSADLRVELSDTARAARDARHGLDPRRGAPTVVSPIGAWTSRVPTTPTTPPSSPRLVYAGGLHERQGVLLLPGILSSVRAAGIDASLVVTGRGPDEDRLRAEVTAAGMDAHVDMRGFLPEYRQVEAALASSAVALAPYVPDPASFSNFSDLSKLKAYAAAGLPMLTTNVPHNAAELEARAGAQVLPFDADSFAAATTALLRDEREWSRRRAAALEYAAGFDWGALFDDVVSRIVASKRR